VASQLRFITCGSVDDGKSTLLGRLLSITDSVLDDQLKSLTADSVRFGTQGDAIDYALLLDGLQAEREQGITIDVAYRFFRIGERRFIAADCPGHAQYTRNMATGASTADAALVLIDARKGLLEQTKRHARILQLLRVPSVVLLVNKMDAVDFDQRRFQEIATVFNEFANEIGLGAVQAIPISALHGDGIATFGANLAWFKGESLLATLLKLPSKTSTTEVGFRMPVQWICRPNSDFRGIAGMIAAGRVRVGDSISAHSGRVVRQATVEQIQIGAQNLVEAEEGQSVMLRLSDALDISRGDVLAAGVKQPLRTDRLRANLIWMKEQALRIGRRYWLKLGTRQVVATIGKIGEGQNSLELNEMASCELHLDAPMSLERHADCTDLGSFILIDHLDFQTVAAGMVVQTLGSEVHWHAGSVAHAERAQQKLQTPRCIWLTGLSGTGKSTIASALDRALTDRGQHVFVLDGDNLRHGLTAHLGFSDADRAENVRLVSQAAKLMVDAGLIVIVCLISPFRAERDKARALFAKDQFLEVFVDTPMAVLQARDTKGMYAKAKQGLIRGFTGIDAPYEAPVAPELHLHTDQATVSELITTLLQTIASMETGAS
jgi:bifunctional enzyme CysN/CysC